MILQLDTVPLVVIDTETTGLHPRVDRIVELAVVKLYPDGKRTSWVTKVNPGIPIPPEATAIHGIIDAQVADAPSFKSLAPQLFTGLKGCDVAGFNVSFDLDMLTAEFERIPAPDPLVGARVVDGFKLFCRLVPRDLSAAVQRFCAREHEGAHGALADTLAALDVIEAQLEQHPDLPRDVAGLNRLLFETPAPGHVDAEGKFYWRHGVAHLGFGNQHAGKRLDQVPRDYLGWIVRANFSEAVKQIARDALRGVYPKKQV